jgi:hypothetical protein
VHPLSSASLPAEQDFLIGEEDVVIHQVGDQGIGNVHIELYSTFSGRLMNVNIDFKDDSHFSVMCTFWAMLMGITQGGNSY